MEPLENTDPRLQGWHKRGGGPIWDRDRKPSCLNAVRHGCRSRSIVLPTESREEFEQVQRMWIEHYGCHTHAEVRMAELVAEADWRQRRSAGFVDSLSTAENLESKKLELARRYHTADQNAFQKAQKNFEFLRRTAPSKRQEVVLEQDVKVCKLPEGTETSLLPSNQWINDQIMRERDQGRQVVAIRRRVEFRDGIPEEYNWVGEPPAEVSDNRKPGETVAAIQMLDVMAFSRLFFNRVEEKLGGHLAPHPFGNLPLPRLAEDACTCPPCLEWFRITRGLR